MYYQYLNAIHKSSKQLLTIKSVNTGEARIFQRGGGGGAKRGREATERGEGVASHGKKNFEISCIKMAFCTLNVIIRDRICEVAYTNPILPPCKIYVTQIKGGGQGPYPLSYASDSDAARICQRAPGPNEGAKQPSGGWVLGREIFENL